MNSQNLANPVITCNLVVMLHETDSSCTGQIYASPRDYGFDSDEDEIAREMLAPLPVNLEDQPIPEVDADEFEKVLQYFFS
jgi:hypothetical protein